MGVMTRAIIYSFIAFSIVFIVLGGLTLVIYAMRLMTGNSSGSESESSGPAPDTKSQAVAKAEPVPSTTGSKAQHVAAVTAAILAATQGQGRILSVTPVGQVISSESTKMWKTAAVMATVTRRLAPSWKR